jgi:hypothetical protein
MKLVSKYKDYWDYLQGIYGVDEKVVFERDSIFKDYSPDTLYYFHILNKTYCGLFTKDGWIHDFDELDKYYKDNSSNRLFYSQSRQLALYLYGEISWWKKNKLLKIYPETLLNIENNCPILVARNNNINKFPLLKDTFIPSILPAHDIYVGLVDWFSYKEPVVETKPEDMIRFESKGFDKKDSFRNVK